MLPGSRWPRLRIDLVADLRRAYDSAGWSPLWIRGGRPTPQALAVVRYLAGIDSVGLAPDDYDVAALDSLAQRLALGAGDEEQGRFEATLSVAAARALASLQWGRVSPRDAHESFYIPRLDFDLAVAVAGAARAATPSQVFAGAEPRLLPYQLLKQALGRYRALARDSVWSPLPTSAALVKEGNPYLGARELRRRLLALGDLVADSTDPVPEADTVYTASLAAGIRSFQRRHGAGEDGVLGPATRRELERPLAERVEQIELALERWRWLPREFAGRVIMVNVPEFKLHAFDRLTSDSTAMVSMDVAVGDAFDNQTPIFMKAMEYLVFAPYWEVPTSIMRTEIRPKAMRDPAYLAANRYVLVRGYTERSPQVPATRENIAQIGRAIRVRQLPGSDNALGRVKFMLPNRHNIYLHDTPAQQAFSRFRRDVSHGCIRLSDPVRLAQWVLQDQPEWTAERIDEALGREAPLTVALRARVPVLIVYGTAVATLDGEMRFFTDIYGHDRELAQLLARGYPYPR